MKKIIDGKTLPVFFHDLVDENFEELNFATPCVRYYIFTLLLDFPKKFLQIHRIIERKDKNFFFNWAKILTRKEIFFYKGKELGDFSLFSLGFFQEHFKEEDFYTSIGKKGYHFASIYYEKNKETLRNLSENFEGCVCGLRRIRSEMALRKDLESFLEGRKDLYL